MKVLETPIQSQEVLKYLATENALNWPILKRYPGYDCCFLAFHPFLKTKAGCVNIIGQNSYENRPAKNEIVKNYDKLDWSDFLGISGIENYKSLDDVLAFYHSARCETNKLEYEKLLNACEYGNLGIIQPDVDYFPEILEDELIKFLLDNNHTEVYLIDEFTEDKTLHNVVELSKDELNSINYLRLMTTDNNLLVVEDFDQRFTYFFGSRFFIEILVSTLALEGFYCDDETTQSWSYDIINYKLSIDLDKKKNIDSKITSNQL